MFTVERGKSDSHNSNTNDTLASFPAPVFSTKLNTFNPGRWLEQAV